jgi:hypothetical protein
MEPWSPGDDADRPWSEEELGNQVRPGDDAERPRSEEELGNQVRPEWAEWGNGEGRLSR